MFIVDRYLLSSAEFSRKLRAVRSEQWTWPTPCSEWNVRQLVNHMARGNLNYVGLTKGGTKEDFLRLRDVDALGTDPVGAYTSSVRACAEAFAQPDVLQRVLDYPMGRVLGEQALAIRTADSIVHTWDLARAIGADEKLEPGLVAWLEDDFEEIYAGLALSSRFFADPDGALADDASRQERLLHRLGR